MKEAHNLNWESWAAADMETHFSTVRPEGSGIFDNGYLSSMKNVDYDQARDSAKSMYETVDFQMDNLNFNVQGNVAIVTYTQTSTNKETGREYKAIRTDVWTLTDGKWLRLHFQITPLTNDLVDMTNRFIEEVWNKGDMSVADELCAPDIVRTTPPSIGAVTNTVEEMKQGIISWRESFPDAKITVDRGMIARGNRVTVQWTFSGTHQGEFMGVAATGKKVTNSGISILTFAKGKIVDTYAMWDPLNLWRQLGVDPPQPPAADSSAAE